MEFASTTPLRREVSLVQVWGPSHAKDLVPSHAKDGEATRILEKLFSRSRKGWDGRLDYVPLKCRKSRRIPVRIKPYKLVRGRSYHLPVKLGTGTFLEEFYDGCDEHSMVFKVH